MSIELNPIVCPQCGSVEIEILQNDNVLCKSCGSKIILTKNENTTNSFISAPVNVFRIPVCFSKEEFLREIMITLCNDNVPLDVFDSEFEIVREEESKIIFDKSSFDVFYQASIGYEREEPYIAYEDYYEEEPYITTEKYKENGITKERQVTKYKRVKKQRQTTKYKIVTDWSATSGKKTIESVAVFDTTNEKDFDLLLFLNSFKNADKNSFALIPEDISDLAKLCVDAKDKIESLHENNIIGDIEYSCPGDYTQDVTIDSKTQLSKTMSLFLVPVYTVSFSYNGKKYTKKAYPFGNMKIGGDIIEKDENIDASINIMTAKSNKMIAELKKDSEKTIWQITKWHWYITYFALIVSTVVSFTIHRLIIIIPLFIAAILITVLEDELRAHTTNEEHDKLQALVTEQKESLKRDLENLADVHTNNCIEAANRKLYHLGIQLIDMNALKERN